MRSIVRGILAVACGSFAVAAAAPGLALDITIPAKVGVIKPAKLAKVVSKDSTGFDLPTPGSADDPTVGGAELSLFDSATPGAGSTTFTLNAAGWKGLGNPAGSKGYKYKGKSDPGSACSVVLIKSTVIKAVCKGTAVTLMPPFAATLGVNLALPAGTTAARRYCAELGGTEAKNDATGLKRKDAPAPSACAEPPSGFNPADVNFLADDALMGRNNNTPGSVTAQNYLIDELQAMGAIGLDSGQTGDAAFKQPYVQSGQTGTNILAIIPGSELPNEYIFVGAHYDHLGTLPHRSGRRHRLQRRHRQRRRRRGRTRRSARGIAALPTAPRRSVVLAFWDAEEDGLLGSLYYTNHPIVPIANTVGYINFDIQGANLLPSLRDFTFAVGAETGTGLGAMVSAAAASSPLDERQLSYIFGQGRSDYVNFGNVMVPTIFYSDSTGPCYHTNADEPAVVDFGKLENQTRRAYDLAVGLGQHDDAADLRRAAHAGGDLRRCRDPRRGAHGRTG